MSGVLEKVIEDWLTNATERGYQASFAAWLTKRGERIVYYSRHSLLEHGKDIVSADSNGDFHAYQLKAGNINANKWRTITAEVREASELPLNYPGIPEQRVSTVTLVVSGSISDGARDKIRLTSSDLRDRGCAEIKTIELHQLIADFASEFETFLPNTIHDITKLLQLYVSDPSSPVETSSLFELFGAIIETNLSDVDPSKESTVSALTIQRLASSLLISGEFLASPYRQAGNAVSTIQVWTATVLACLYLEECTGVSRANTVGVVDICKKAIQEAADVLILQCDDFESAIRDRSLAGIFLSGFKKAYVLGYLAGIANMRWIDGCNDSEAFEALAKAVDGPTGTTLWGEGTWNFVLNVSCVLYRHDDTRFLGRSIIEDWVEYIVNDDAVSPPDCYHTVEDEFDRIAGYKTEANVHRTSEASYTLKSAVDFPR